MEDGQRHRGLERMLGVLERRAMWVVVCVLLGTGVGFFISKRQAKEYTATASLVFTESQPGQRVAGLAATSSTQRAQRSTNVKLLQLGDVAEKTALQLDHGLTKGAVRAALKVRAEG